MIDVNIVYHVPKIHPNYKIASLTLVRVPGVEPGKHIGFELTAYTYSAIPAWCRPWESNPQVARNLNPQHMPILLHRPIFHWRPVRDLNP